MEKATCTNCGSPILESDAGGSCPLCLMGLGMNKTADRGRNPGNFPTMSAPGRPFPIPRVEELVGKFPNLEIEHFIGHGGMGAVYQARQIGLDRKVALKILSPHLGSDPAFTERFTREARTLAKLNHPNIVMVFEHGQTDLMNYLVMEFVDGVNLRDAVSEGRLSPEEALNIVPQVCDALQFAHDEGVIHRDIKPENILLDKKGRVKIADFGLAKLLEPSQDEFTLTGTQQVLGTRNYMAPEQIETPDVVDHRADLYSLGVVFYELLTGELPIGRFALPSEKAEVTNHLDNVVMRTLEKEPDRRFQQASQLKSAVSSVADRTHATAASEAAGFAPRPSEQFAQPNSQPTTQPNAQPQPASASAGFHQPNNQMGALGTTRLSGYSVPFSIAEIYAGFAVAYGIAHIRDVGMELEYEVRDDLIGTVKSDLKRVVIPFGNIVHATIKKGIFSDRIDVQTDNLEAAKDVPNNKQGMFSISIKKADRERAMVYVEEVNRMSATARKTTAYPQSRPTPPVKAAAGMAAGRAAGMAGQANPAATNFEDANSSAGMQHLPLAFQILGIFNLLYAIRTFRLGAPDQFSVELPWITSISFTLPIPVAGLFGIGAAIGMFFIADKLKNRTDYGIVVAGIIALLMFPAFSYYLFTLPICVWALINLVNTDVKNSFDKAAEVPTTYQPPKTAEPNSVAALLLLLFLGMCFFGVAIFLWFAVASKKSHPVSAPTPAGVAEYTDAPSVPTMAAEVTNATAISASDKPEVSTGEKDEPNTDNRLDENQSDEEKESETTESVPGKDEPASEGNESESENEGSDGTEQK